MWDVKACRSCLAVKGKLEKIGEALKRQYTAITGLQMSNDGYPTYFCMECRQHIKKSLAFRRKSHRAHFVLKEIVAVRKQISYSDIVTVNRRKTNLESSLNYWEPKNNACYVIANQEGEEDNKQSNNLAPLPLNYSKTFSTHLVDIEPEVETPVETNEPPVEPKGSDDYLFNEEDIPTNDYLETDDVTNIDMNDIFKDLDNEPVKDDDDDGIEDLKPESVKPTKIKKEKRVRDDLSTINVSMKILIEMLALYDLKVLTIEEQKKRFEILKNRPSFANAHYKCAVCLTVYANMRELMVHVDFHNERKFDYECQVCKNKLPTAEDLNGHMANYHMYEYQCRMCKSTVYSQVEALVHIKTMHPSWDPQEASSREGRRKKKLAVGLSMFTIAPLTHEMMYEVMKLESRAGSLRGADPKKMHPLCAKNRFNFKCDICGIWFELRKHLEKHMTLKHRFMYTCKVCKEVFTTRKQALEHGNTHEKQFECGDCGKLFSKNTKFQEHRKNAHIRDRNVPCNICGYMAKHDRLHYGHQLRQHGYISLNDELTGDPQFKCEQCGVQFIDNRSLTVHLVNSNHAGADNIELACIPCKKLFESQEQLETHYITCIYSRKYPRSCCYCPEMLNNPQEYKSHYFQQHPTLPYRYVSQNCICDVCGKSVFKPHLEAHLKSHFSGGYTCRLCSYSSTSSARHVAHVLSFHTPRPYLCALCPRRFRHRYNCKLHVLKVHAPTKLYKCDFCDKEFSYFQHLKEHSETLHNLVIPSVKSAFPLNSVHNKLYVYAHMRIEINEIERPIVEKTNIELVDYLELKSKPVDYNNYFIFNPHIEENVYCKKDSKKTKKKKKRKTELETAVDKIKTVYDTVVDPVVSSECEQIETKINENEINGNKDDEMVVDEGQFQEEKPDSTSSVNEVDLGVENASNEVVVPSGEDPTVPLEVIESEGHQYVVIDGEMYRIACEDEV